MNKTDCFQCVDRPTGGFKKNLRFYRKSQKISDTELAEYCHVSYQTISKYECGQRTPTPSVLVLLAQRLGISVDALLMGELD